MLSLAITAFEETSDRRNNGKNILRCISAAQASPYIDDITIVDDGSDDFEELSLIIAAKPKVYLYHNQNNRGVFGNKIEAIAHAKNDWVVTCDSDNFMDKEYLARVALENKNWQTWYLPSFARPKFDYRALIGEYDLSTLFGIVNRPIFPCLFNTGNQVVQRTAFLNVFGEYRDKRADLIMPNWLNIPQGRRENHYWRMVFDACDSFLFNYYWVLAGNRINIMEDWEYDHRYATGDDGNYSRSPKEKGDLGAILLAELKEGIECAQ